MTANRIRYGLGALLIGLTVLSAPALAAPKKPAPPPKPLVSNAPVFPKTLPGKPAGYKVDLNTATASELQLLPFVGPNEAKGIIAHRPFKSVNDLLKVKGMAKLYVKAIEPHAKI